MELHLLLQACVCVYACINSEHTHVCVCISIYPYLGFCICVCVCVCVCVVVLHQVFGHLSGDRNHLHNSFSCKDFGFESQCCLQIKDFMFLVLHFSLFGL